ncbi:phage GP46 family protein [Variovorax sp. 3P27G3]|jgi:phage gp46-like protein|uniref:phage GP46 family protein n=1 Tax=Variovorax sp. 3P27G3 TaxID=2502214 RepID=UPI0010F50798|nr:phage GP46 family protein [Variovorax sp. 3P27G3]
MDAELFYGCGPEACADVRIACGDLVAVNELSTAVFISLFTDRRANEDDVLPDGTDPRGWWADAMEGQRIGSRLWLLERARNLPEVMHLAEEYALEALAWLIEDRVAKKVTATAAAVGGCKNVLALTVQIFKPDGRGLQWKFRYAWDLRAVQDWDALDCASVLATA